jgi:hypothetical protein
VYLAFQGGGKNSPPPGVCLDAYSFAILKVTAVSSTINY